MIEHGDLQCRHLLFPAMIVSNFLSPLSFCRVWQSKVLVSFFGEPPIVLNVLVQSGFGNLRFWYRFLVNPHRFECFCAIRDLA